MAAGFPLVIDLVDNNCIVFGGGTAAAARAALLLRFGAKVTVISPALCPALEQLDAQNAIRYIPRRYYRGDCTSSYLCVAATDDDAVNQAIAAECKAKAVAVNVVGNEAYGTFRFPEVVLTDDVALAVSGPVDTAAAWRALLEQELPRLRAALE